MLMWPISSILLLRLGFIQDSQSFCKSENSNTHQSLRRFSKSMQFESLPYILQCLFSSLWVTSVCSSVSVYINFFFLSVRFQSYRIDLCNLFIYFAQKIWKIQPFAFIQQKNWQYVLVCKLYKCVSLFRNAITLKSSYVRSNLKIKKN